MSHDFERLADLPDELTSAHARLYNAGAALVDALTARVENDPAWTAKADQARREYDDARSSLDELVAFGFGFLDPEAFAE